jgi:hypothetical protein
LADDDMEDNKARINKGMFLQMIGCLKWWLIRFI